MQPMLAGAINILLVVMDDVGVDRVGAYGFPEAAPTPTLDAIAAVGVKFNAAYANPVCSPTRTSILTGRYGLRTGIGISVPWSDPSSPNGQFAPSLDEPWLPQQLVGYRTVAIGKWHLDISDQLGYEGPLLRGFEFHEGPMQNLGGAGAPASVYWDYEESVNGVPTEVTGSYAVTEKVDDTLDYIGQFGDDPWFVWLALNSAHSPFHEPPPELTTITEFDDNGDRHRAMVEALDTELFRLFTSIDAAVLSRTAILVIGDNGTPASTLDGVTKAKGTVYERGVRVPMLFWMLGVQPGEFDGLVNSTDLYRMVCKLAGARVPAAAVDALPLGARKYVYVEKHLPNGFGPYNDRRRAIRNDRYKYVRRTGVITPSPGMEFFDLLEDPNEQSNLLFGGLPPELQPIFDELQAKLADP